MTDIQDPFADLVGESLADSVSDNSQDIPGENPLGLKVDTREGPTGTSGAIGYYGATMRDHSAPSEEPTSSKKKKASKAPAQPTWMTNLAKVQDKYATYAGFSKIEGVIT